MPDNLLLLSMGLTTHFFTPAPQYMSMVMGETKTGRGKWYIHEKMKATPRV
jgi:hypothetical protein